MSVAAWFVVRIRPIPHGGKAARIFLSAPGWMLQCIDGWLGIVAVGAGEGTGPARLQVLTVGGGQFSGPDPAREVL